MKRILIITNSHRPDDSRIYQKITLSLAKRYQVTIFHNSILKTEALNGISFYRNENAGKINFIRNALKLIKLEKPDLIICVEPVTLFIGNLAKLLYHIPFIYDCHEFFSEAFSEKYKHLQSLFKETYRLAEILLYYQSDGIVTVNQLLVDEMIRYQKNTIYCGNYPHLQTSDTINVPKVYDLIYIGGISRYRGLDVMIQAVHEMKLKKRFISLLIIGKFLNQTEESYARNAIEQFDISDLIDIKDFVSSNNISEYIKTAKIGLSILNPAVNRYQKAIPLKLLEYMQFGLPVITNDFSMIKEIVEKNQCGYCVSYKSESIVSAINEMLDDNDSLKQYAHNAINLIQTRYNWQNEENKLLNFIKGIIHD